MRFARTMVLVAVGLLWLALGPVVLLVAALALLRPAVRGWLRPTRRVLGAWVGVLALLAAVVAVVPDGWVRMPPGPGAWVTPAYVGRPVVGTPQLGPAGESPTVASRSYGLPGCRSVLPLGRTRLVTACGTDAPVVRLVDAESLGQVARAELPGRGCRAPLTVVGAAPVVAGGRRVLRLDPSDLVVTSSLDLGGALRAGDCVTGLGADATGRLWFASRDGVVGVVTGSRVRTVVVHDRVDQPLTVGTDPADPAVYVAGRRALHRVALRGERPVEAWRSAYDGGVRGAAPVLLPSGLVAVADNRSPRLQVVFHRAATGAVACRVEVFDDDEGSTDGGLAAAGSGVVVTNAHGYAGPRSTMLGRTADRGLARVDATADGSVCRVAWRTDMAAASGSPVVSAPDGLVYAWTKRHSWLGVDAWYLAALDLHTGRLVWARRTGLTPLADLHGGAVSLGPGHAAYAATLGGIIRVRDRQPG